MIYSKVDNPLCSNCIHAKLTENGGNVLCDIKGTVPADFCCKKYKYDIFKKKIKPRKTLKINKFSKQDFDINV